MATESLTLKWGSIKAWDLKTEASLAAMQKYLDAGSVCMSAALQEDNDAQKAAICELIDALDNDQVYLCWDGVYVSKEEAKAYVMKYGEAKA